MRVYVVTSSVQTRANDYVVKLLLRLVAAHHQLATRCPALLDGVLSALFESILTSFVANLPAIECFDAGASACSRDVFLLCSHFFLAVRSRSHADDRRRRFCRAHIGEGGLAERASVVADARRWQARYASAQTKRVGATLHRQLALAAKAAGVEGEVDDARAQRARREALEMSRRSTRVLFACFAADDGDGVESKSSRNADEAPAKAKK